MGDISEIHERLYVYLKTYNVKVDNKSFYSYRKSNIGGYLDKGYWFLGDDSSIIITFWTGVERSSKLPLVRLVMDENDKIILEISGEYDIQANEEIIKNILKQFDFERSAKGKDVFQLILGSLITLEQVLFEFLRVIKPVIDDIIRSHSSQAYSNAGVKEDVISFIKSDVFISEHKKIDKYRKAFVKLQEFEISQNNSSEKPIHIKSFKVKNFAIIKSAEFCGIPKTNRWVFLTGENGSGKSLLLKSLAFALAQGVVPKKYSKYTNAKPFFELELMRSNGKSEIYTRNGDNDAAKYARTPCVNGFAAYGTFRHEFKNRIVEKDILSKNGSLESITSDDKVISLIDFNKVLQLWGENPSEYIKFDKRKRYLADILISIVPGLVDIQFEKGIKRINAEYWIDNQFGSQIKLSYNQLSSGTRSILSLVADIFIRFYHQQPRIEDPSQFTGVVLIDEIDLHLHPKGQRDLVRKLGNIFPKIQFIVSTHSPIPLLGAPKDSVFINVVRDERNGILLKRIDDKIYFDELLPNTILTSPIFGMDDIFPVSFTGEKIIRTETSFNEIEINNYLDNKIQNFITDEVENRLIERIKTRRLL